jgi:hypothetical protein
MSQRRQRAIDLQRFMESVFQGDQLALEEWCAGLRLLIANDESPDPAVQGVGGTHGPTCLPDDGAAAHSAFSASTTYSS